MGKYPLAGHGDRPEPAKEPATPEESASSPGHLGAVLTPDKVSEVTAAQDASGVAPPVVAREAQAKPAAPSLGLRGGSWAFAPEPDSPFRPHNAVPRCELLGRCPRVLITPEAYKRMLLFVEIASKEVGWLGSATRMDNGDFLVDSVFLLEQEVSATETELSVEGQIKLLDELLARGDEGLELANRLRFWGHSHVRMGTGPSWTDESTMKRFGDEGLPWYIRGIFNKRGRAEFTIYLYDLGYRICDAPWMVWDPQKRLPLLAQPKTSLLSSFSLSGQGFRSLPKRLMPQPELRQQVQAEFSAKVTEKPGWSLLFGQNQAETAGGLGETTSLAEPVAGFDGFNSGCPNASSINERTGVAAPGAPGKNSKESGWLSKVLEDFFRDLFK